jgi:hypothetical protein
MALTKVTTHVIADDIALGGNPTTTTQSAGNNTTRIATTAFVTGALSDLVDSAPSTLNTLNELAAALGDDANFSTTVTNSIAAKLPLAGGTMTGALNMGSQNITAANRISTADGISDTGQAGSSTVFNESGSTADFRIESDSNTHMFFLDAGQNSIGINQSQPSSSYVLDVGGQIRSTGNSPAFNLREDDSSNQHYQIGSYGGVFAVRDVTGSSYPLQINTTGVGIGVAPGDDFEVKTDNSMSFVSDTSDSISFGTSGTNKPCIKFDTADTTNTNRVFAIENGAGTRLNFFRNGLDLFRLNQDGHVEIPGTFSAGNYPNGTSNVCLGSTAGGNFGSGNNYNVAIGDAALTTAGSGDVNVAVGYHALRLNTSGYHNVAIGSSDNSSVGAPLGSNTEGRNNIAIGRGALEKNTTGISNTAVGDHALGGTTGQSNTANNNTAVGKDTLNLTYGVDNTAIGKGAGAANTSGKRNLFVGIDAGAANTTQDENCFVGRRAGQNATVSQTTAVGTEALQNCTGNYNTAVGTQALMYNTSGVENTAVGRLALNANVSGDLNTAVGHQALDTLTGGDRNTAVGREALRDLGASGTPGNNTAVGSEAGKLLTTGVQNVAVGSYAMNSNLTASNNVCIGYRAGEDITSGSNVFIGTDAAKNATGTDTSVVIGYDAGTSLTTAGNNVLIGSSAGDDLTTGGQNVVIGKLCDAGAAGAVGRVVLGYSATGATNNSITIGYGSSDSAFVMGNTGDWYAPSDERLKEDIQDETIGLAFINDLRPRTFRWKKRKDVPEELSWKYKEEDLEERLMNGKYNHGFVAQEVKATIENHNLKDGFGFWMQDDTEGNQQRVGGSELIPLLVKSIQELSEKVNELEEKLNGN